jgi:hypothetical protein
MMRRWAGAVSALVLVAGRACADEASVERSPSQAMVMSGALGPYDLRRDAGGTSWQPDATPMEGLHRHSDGWMLMAHGGADLVATRESGPRGGSQVFSNSAFMITASRPAGRGTLGLEAMVSLEPINGAAGYPLLLQSGETADGKTPLVDRQHPHNLIMGLAASYARRLNEVASWFVYAAPVGEPALGPTAFLHRRSTGGDPLAPISHHWLDSTHVTMGVVTTGVVVGNVKIETSAFNGREPDQHRYALELRSFDSWSGRITWNPRPDVSVQVSTGRLASPEALEPTVAVRRSTASISHETTSNGWEWSSTLAVGRNTPTLGAATNAVLLETSARRASDTVYLRAERVEKTELFGPVSDRPYPVRKLSAGYSRELGQRGPFRLHAGVVLSRDAVPAELTPTYGEAPWGIAIYLGAKLAP